MISIILYLAIALACVACYFIFSSEFYLNSGKGTTYSGTIERVITEETTEQYLISFTEEHEVQRTAMSPLYEKNGRYETGNPVKLTYSRIRFFRYGIGAGRIEDQKLVKKEVYKAFLLLALFLLVLTAFRFLSLLVAG